MTYGYDYNRDYHPSYQHVQLLMKLNSHLFQIGCFGSCNFCALAFHQGRIIQARSHESIIAEANKMVWDPNFKGCIHDVGGPTANFRDTACDKQKTKRGLSYKTNVMAQILVK